MTNNFDISKYSIDFSDDNNINWIIVKIIIPKEINKYYHNKKTLGVLLHDNKLAVDNILFDENEYMIIDKNPTNRYNYK